MLTRDIIVVGGSAGGLEAFKQLVSALPPDVAAAIFFVWHLSPHTPSLLPALVAKAGTLPAHHPIDGEPIQRGQIYVAPPDYHLQLEPEQVRLTRGPKENRFRPAIDPLFRSAAYAFGPRVIGVVLSGGLDDGTAGLWTIKDRGGIAIVQDPTEAQHPSMPRSAKEQVEIDYCLPVAAIAARVVELTRQPIAEKEQTPMAAKLTSETQVGLQKEDTAAEAPQLGEPSAFTCPDCHGALLRIQNGRIIHYRCHTGHAFSPQSLIAALTEATENALWNALRILQEEELLLQHMAQHATESEREERAVLLLQHVQENQEQADLVRKALRVQGAALVDD
jgi:two-component system chemotaxis response regulator CheB